MTDGTMNPNDTKQNKFNHRSGEDDAQPQQGPSPAPNVSQVADDTAPQGTAVEPPPQAPAAPPAEPSPPAAPEAPPAPEQAAPEAPPAPDAPVQPADAAEPADGEMAEEDIPQPVFSAAEEFNGIHLQDVAPGLRHIKVALGWDAPETVGQFDYDLDAAVFILGHDGRVRADNDFIFYNNLTSSCGNVIHAGDDENGRAPGDNEQIEVKLDQLAFDVSKLVFTISLHNAPERDQTFHDVKSGFIRIINLEDNQEIARFDLANKSPDHSGIVFAELVRNNDGNWDFSPLNAPHELGLYGIASDFGVFVADPN